MKILKLYPGADKIEAELDNLFLNESGYASERKIILGEDHLLTKEYLRKFLDETPGAGLVLFDAHPDCDHSLKEKDLLIDIIENKLISPEKIIIIGIRNWKPSEKEFLDQHKIRYFTMKKIFQMGLQETCDTIMETVRGWPSFYLSIDIDVVDPAFAPGVEVKEPGGFTSRELIYFLQRLKLLKNLGMVDLMEIKPELDANDLTVKLSAKIIKEIS